MALDPTLLKTFMTIVAERSFTAAGKRLNLRQSTVSQHVRKLETLLDRRLIERSTHHVGLTPDGEALLRHANAILEAYERAHRQFSGSELKGRVRFGASEDFVMTRLPEVLREFASVHPSVQLELTVALSAPLFAQLDAGQLDLVLGKRLVGQERGTLIRRERMVWLASDGYVVDPSGSVPLILYPAPSIGRTTALEALDRVSRPWHQVCSSTSFSGLYAATLAGFGVMVQAESVVPPGLRVVGPDHGLPQLSDVEFVLAGATTSRGPVGELAAAILAKPWTAVDAPMARTVRPRRHSS